jgi:hypothetical protein
MRRQVYAPTIFQLHPCRKKDARISCDSISCVCVIKSLRVSFAMNQRDESQTTKSAVRCIRDTTKFSAAFRRAFESRTVLEIHCRDHIYFLLIAPPSHMPASGLESDCNAFKLKLFISVCRLSHFKRYVFRQLVKDYKLQETFKAFNIKNAQITQFIITSYIKVAAFSSSRSPSYSAASPNEIL